MTTEKQKIAQRERSRRYRQRHYEEWLAAGRIRDKARYQDPKRRAWTLAYKKKPEQRFYVLERSAKLRGYTVDISVEEYETLIIQDCHYCKSLLGKLQDETGGGLDRLDNGKGYILENVVPCCQVCNYIRGDYLTVEETQAAVNAVVQLRLTKARPAILSLATG